MGKGANKVPDIRKFQLIQHLGQPLAARFLTVNTEVYSTLNTTSILLYIKQGRLQLYRDKEEITYRAGNMVLLLEFSDFKAQRILSKDSNIFEALVFVLPELNANAFLKSKNGSNTILQRPITIKTEILLGCFDELTAQFLKTTPLNLKHIDELRNKVLKMVKVSNGQSIEHHLSSARHRLLSFLFLEVTTNVTVKELAKKYGTSESTFYRIFIREIGVSPHRWIKDQRLHYARCEMQFRQKKASEMYLELGFEDLAHFSKEFKKKFGYNPSDTYENAQIEIIGS
ncbi:MAG: AraC family transcriptional regulator [Bacteroidota bacterium]